MRTHAELKDRWGTALGLEAASCLAAARGEFERALHLHGAASALAKSMRAAFPGIVQSMVQQAMATAQQVLAEPVRARALAEGQAMSLEQAVAYALEGQAAAIP